MNELGVRKRNGKLLKLFFSSLLHIFAARRKNFPLIGDLSSQWRNQFHCWVKCHLEEKYLLVFCSQKKKAIYFAKKNLQKKILSSGIKKKNILAPFM